MKQETFDLLLQLMTATRPRNPVTVEAARLIMVEGDEAKAKELCKNKKNGQFINVQGFCNRLWMAHRRFFINSLIDEPPADDMPYRKNF